MYKYSGDGLEHIEERNLTLEGVMSMRKEYILEGYAVRIVQQR